MTLPVYQTPTRGDFQRNLSVIIHEARAKIRAENGRITNSLAAKGLAQSGVLISQIASCANDLHAKTIEKSMQLIREFTTRSRMTPIELGEAARPMLENLEIEWLAPLHTKRYPQPRGQPAAAE